MKTCHNLFVGVGFFILCCTMFTACVNHISEEEGEIINNGDIPLKFVADIHEIMNTRVVNNSFGEKDEVGLFALAGTTTMQEERYADNLHFVRSSTGEFVSDESVYYPDDGVTLNLISYYPYQKGGVAMGESSMQVTVATTQDKLDDYSHSDFLVASKKEVLASKDAVALTYNHQFFRMKIVLVPGEGENIEEILSVKPTLSVSGFYTKTIYDFQKKTFSAYSEEKDITPAGEWEIKDGRLVGKELILIPQEATVGYQYITLEAAGKLYTSLLPSTLQLESGKQRELEITFVSAEDILMSKVDGEIGDWDGTEVDHTESVILHKYIDVSKLTFEKSNVYKVIHSGKQVAEICKEYLLADNIDAQAIVVYPVLNGATDLNNGTVICLLDEPASIHGGKVSWNKVNNALDYTPGNQSIISDFYITQDNSISISKPENPLPVRLQEEVLTDIRNTETQTYPIVKIGIQYWMGRSLEATHYTDGKAITLKKDFTTTAGYYTGKFKDAPQDFYFYNSEAVISGKLSPQGWSIPTETEWELLKQYINNDASKLKFGPWSSDENGDKLPILNITGFNGVPEGYILKSKNGYTNGLYTVVYWSTNSSGNQTNRAIYLLHTTNEIKDGNITDRALSVRCIRK